MSREITGRLTWDPAWPAPFESLWSVIVKVVVLNHLTVTELFNLIKQRDIGRVGCIIDAANTWWIDFDRFGSLLGVAPARIKQGCWDQLGVMAVNRACDKKICPECWASHLYHCAFFDLSTLVSCPWHHCPLTASCPSCSLESTFSLRSRDGMPARRACTACRRALPDTSRIIDTPRVEGDFEQQILKSCTALMRWWTVLGERFPARDRLLSDLARVTPPKHGEDQYLGWQRYVASTAMRDMPLSWKFSGDFVPCKYFEWTETIEAKPGYDEYHHDPMDMVQGDAGRCYRSLRNHLYKTYVRQHRSCYSKLLRLTHGEAVNLDGANLCLAAFSFMIWRMAIEAVVWIEGLRMPRPPNYRLRLMREPQFHGSSVRGRLHLSYFGFFAIWKKLELLCKRPKFRVVLSGDTNFNVYLHYHCSINSNDKDKSPERQAQAHYCVLYPRPDILVAKANVDCRRTRSKDVCRLPVNDVVGRTTDDGAEREWLFQVRRTLSPSLSTGQFWYFQV